jgi:hypothetical protein
MTVEKAVNALVELLASDQELVALGFGAGTYRRKYAPGADTERPDVAIATDGSRITLRGPGWQKEVAVVHALFRIRAARETDLPSLERVSNRVRAVIEANGRLGKPGAGTEVDRAKWASWKPIVVRGADYIEGIADVSVEVVMYRKV